uniref:FPV250 n=1 Tax=Aquarana catesbeiana TaxID=8400 RepID=C1C3V1_AQUCT|nr:FPV250 [Aquarana catesbeiana]
MLINIFMYSFSSPAADSHDLLVDNFVENFSDDLIRPPDNEVTNNLHIRICGLDGTVYSGENYRLESWGQNFLPKPTKMKVLGIIESSSGMLLFPQWIVLVAKNGRVYGYKEEVLFLHANSLEYLVKDGIKNIETYTDDISDEEEEVLQNDKEVQRLRQATKEFIDKDADEFNDFYAQFI